MIGMLELSDQEFKTTMIAMLRALMGKVDNIQEQMDNKQREGNSLKSQNEILGVKTLLTEMKNDFDGLISRLDTAEEKYSWVRGYLNRKLPNCKAKRKKTDKKTNSRTEYPRTASQLQKA